MELEFAVRRRAGTLPQDAALFDTSRSWLSGGLDYPVRRSVGGLPQTAVVFDLARVWGVGGLNFLVRRRVNPLPESAACFDLTRNWAVGGLNFTVLRKVGPVPSGSLKFDTFRLKEVTLGERAHRRPRLILRGPVSSRFWLVRRAIRPYGLPWLEHEVVHPAWCWKITLRDGTVLGFTSHDQDLELGGVVYEASSGFVPSAVETQGNMAVDNLEVQGFLDSERIRAADIEAGRFDLAQIEVMVCNWRNLKDPVLILRRGTLGQIRHGEQSYTAEMLGLLAAYQQSAGKTYQKLCRASLGDAHCKIPLAAFSANGAVTAVNPDGTIGTTLAEPDGYFDYGALTFSSGTNAGFSVDIKGYEQAGGRIIPFLPPLFTPEIGDLFAIAAGCDRNLSTCKNRFHNAVNFRGEPYIPGNDYMAAYPGRGTANTKLEGENPRRV